MRIIDFVSADAIVGRLSSSDAKSVVAELATSLAETYNLEPPDVRQELLNREQLGSTAIGHQIAVPHGKLAIPRPMGLLGLSDAGIDYGAPDGDRVRLFVAFVSPMEGAVHLKALAAVAQELADHEFQQRLLAATHAAQVYDLLARERPQRSSNRLR